MTAETRIVEITHPRARRLVFNGPETHDDRPRPGDLEGPAQAEYALPRSNLSRAGIAGGEHGPLRSLKIKPCNLLRRQDAVVGARAPGRAHVCARERKPRQQQRVFTKG